MIFMQNIESLSLFLFITGMVGFTFINYMHIMNMLIMLEFMMLSILLMVSMYSGTMISGWLILILIFFMVCESVIGISCVILVSRSHGKDEMESLTMLKC